MNIDIKTLLPVLTGAAVLGGFYYTTQHRLDILEVQIKEIEIELSKVKKIANKIKKNEKN